MSPYCPNDGLPMSLADGGHIEWPYWTCDGPNDNTDRRGCDLAVNVRGVLTRDITAADMAVDSLDDEGYPPGHIIGPAGSLVTVIDADGDTIEAEDFANDPFVQGFINRADITIVEES